jgi:hypothetical protein
MYFGTEPDQIDHRNTDGVDNRIGNLRKATHAQNCQNSSLMSRNTSGFKGVDWSKEKKKFRARRGKRHLGYFDIASDAHAAYCAAASEEFGQFFNPG